MAAPKTLGGIRSAVRRLLGDDGDFYVGEAVWSATIYGLGDDISVNSASTPTDLLRDLEKKLLAHRAAQLDRRVPKLDREQQPAPKRVNGRVPKRIEYRGGPGG